MTQTESFPSIISQKLCRTFLFDKLALAGAKMRLSYPFILIQLVLAISMTLNVNCSGGGSAATSSLDSTVAANGVSGGAGEALPTGVDTSVTTPSTPANRPMGSAVIDLSSANLSPSVAKFSGASNFSKLGSAVSLADVTGDGRSDMVMLAGGISSGLFTVYGSSNPVGIDFSKTTLATNQGLYLTNSIKTLSGSLVVADLDNDNKSDVIFADPSNGIFPRAGTLFGFWGNTPAGLGAAFSTPDITTTLNVGTLPSFQINGAKSDDLVGQFMTGIGDINGDGFDDFASGLPGRCQGAMTAAGSVTIVFGSSRANIGINSILPINTVTQIELKGLRANGKLGQVIAGAGDVNGDGIADFALGDPNYNNGNGAIFVIYGSTSVQHLSQLSSLDFSKPIPTNFGFRILSSAFGSQHFGSSISIAGDVDGDGANDILVGQQNPNGTWAYLIFGAKDSAKLAELNDLDIADDILNKLSVKHGVILYAKSLSDTQSSFGLSVSLSGDIDHDGYGDILISDPSFISNQGVVAGKVYLIYGRPKSAFAPFTTLKDSLSESGQTIPATMTAGRDYVEYLGPAQVCTSLTQGFADVNGDLNGDFIIGSPGDLATRGACYLIKGAKTF